MGFVVYRNSSAQFSPLLIWILFGAKLFPVVGAALRQWNGIKLVQDITITTLRFRPTNLIFMLHYGGVKVAH